MYFWSVVKNFKLRLPVWHTLVSNLLPRLHLYTVTKTINWAVSAAWLNQTEMHTVTQNWNWILAKDVTPVTKGPGKLFITPVGMLWFLWSTSSSHHTKNLFACLSVARSVSRLKSAKGFIRLSKKNVKSPSGNKQVFPPDHWFIACTLRSQHPQL